MHTLHFFKSKNISNVRIHYERISLNIIKASSLVTVGRQSDENELNMNRT